MVQAVDRFRFLQAGIQEVGRQERRPARTGLPETVQIADRYPATERQHATVVPGHRIPDPWVFNATKDKTGNYSLQALGKTGYTPSVDEFISTVSGFIK